MKAEVKVPARAKRQALIALVVKAVEEGKISLDSDEDDEEEEDEEIEDEEAVTEDYDEEEVEDSDDEESDEDEEEIDPLDEDQMTDERKEACKTAEKNIKAEYKRKKLSDKEIDQVLSEALAEDEYDAKASKEEKLEQYIDLTKILIS